ncbi:MAG: L,D-transpeptidase [Deltaproteobacteria bacterium]|nr:L,D-transpeptidase [Deltaproteobacteria bacterium]
MVLAVMGCGGSGTTHVATPTETRVVIHATQPPVIAPLEKPATATPATPTTTTVRFLTNTVLRKEPRANAAKVGIIRKDARAAQRTTAIADGCKDDRWIQIVPRGWACESAIEVSSEQPTTGASVTLDAIDDGEPVPGVYGRVRGADVSTSVRAAAVVTIDGARYWRTSGGALIPAAAIVQFSPSKFRGIALDKTTSMPAWVRGRSDSRKSVRTYEAPRGKIAGELAPRTIVHVLEESADGVFVRVADDVWVARKDLRVASRTTPPVGTGPTEKWFDVDRDEQVLVAYEGDQPVYATMVSTGKWGHATPTVITRVSSKLLTASMNNDRGDEQYAVADVPWTMYYDNSYALHTSYWHDGFGGPRSHGCVNLAPRDARLLYQWSSPDVPPGWIAVYGDQDNPGSLVRVRSRSMPEPKFRGYAKALRDRDRNVAATTN